MKRCYPTLIIFSFVFLLPSLPHAQSMALSRQYISENMGNQSANAFLEDRFGFIWIGGNTLYRYDGYSILPYHPLKGDSTPTSMGRVHALLEDAGGRIWIGASNGLFHYERATDKLFHHPIPALDNQRNKSDIFSLHQDKAGRIWIGGKEQLLVMEAPEADEFRVVEGIAIEARWQEKVGVTAIVENQSGGIFAATTSGLWEVGPGLSSKQHLPKAYPSVQASFRILDAAQGMGDSLWLATTEGLWVFRAGNKVFSKIELPAKAGKIIHRLLIGKKNEVWLGSKDRGLLKPEKGGYVPVPLRPDKPSSIFFDYIRALRFDRFGNLWVGTMAGIHRLNFELQKFPFYQIDPGLHSYMNYTHRVLEDSLGGLWFRLIQLGLGYCSGLGAELEVLLQPESHAEIEEVKNFCLDADGNVWVITLTNGLYKFERGRKNYEHIPLGEIMKQANALSILADQKDDRYLWFSSRLGLCRVDRFSYQLEWFDPKEALPWLDDHFVGGIAQSENGHIWCAVRSERGVHTIPFDRRNKKFIAEPNNPVHSSSATNRRNYHLMPVPDNKLWVGTDNGVMVIDADDGSFKRLLPEEGFPLKNVLSIRPDKEGNIWFTGDSNRICRFDGRQYDCYTAPDHIGHFNYNSATLGKDGRITFGGANGIYSFYPDEIVFEQDTTKPEVYLTNFKVFNRKRHLNKGYELVEDITLPYKENVFTFEFAGLHFTRPERIKYRYRLEGFDEDWTEADSKERTATYTNLSPGAYTFAAQASTADGAWPAGERGLRIELTVLPPWYRSWWAYGLYLLAISGLLLGARSYEIRRQLAKAEARQYKELDDFKSRFYTNITHEFRTPLTIILGMAKKMKTDPQKWLDEGIHMIQRNGQSLLRLVNQMLDLSKLESGKLKLNPVQGDVIPYLRYIFESFYSYAEAEDIRLHFRSEPETLVMDYDPDQLMNIVSNLLSNAVKFTGKGGEVKFEVGSRKSERPPTSHFLHLSIQDTGIGIPEEELPFIFDRFYSPTPSPKRREVPAEGPFEASTCGDSSPLGGGTERAFPSLLGGDRGGLDLAAAGIGLALVKELVKLMAGKIEVKSTVGEGSEFIVCLPIRREAPPIKSREWSIATPPFSLSPEDFQPKAPPETGSDGNRPTALIVEDNADVIRYLIFCLEGEYQLEVAQNGREGIDKALDLVPEIIVSDVMMPGIDGYELCDTLKRDIRTSHIPIVLLTAKADKDSRISGLRKGADAYLAKPFHEEELLARLSNLLELRRNLQKKYRSADFLMDDREKAPEGPGHSLEEDFLRDFYHKVEEHLTDYDLDVSKLCRLMAMSRTQLYRKLIALTGMSANKFIRAVRLKKARELLRSTNLTIMEVAYDSGFNNANYFSRVFSEEFGMSPTEYRERLN
ncbi:MAG: helix-turn-helix domain-containing protein [Lewinellaceae bacterium]|nr:helix-turn-helix domain-containing protein [Lewinellaceae bacterium]